MLADLVRADSEFQSLGAAAEKARAAKTVLGYVKHAYVKWLATCIPVQDLLSQVILSISTTCGISGCWA